MHAAPECWGKFDKCSQPCKYAEACRLCTETEPAMNRPLYGQDYDSVAGWAPDLADYSHIPGDEPEEEEKPTPETQTSAAKHVVGPNTLTTAQNIYCLLTSVMSSPCSGHAILLPSGCSCHVPGLFSLRQHLVLRQTSASPDIPPSELKPISIRH